MNRRKCSPLLLVHQRCWRENDKTWMRVHPNFVSHSIYCKKHVGHSSLAMNIPVFFLYHNFSTRYFSVSVQYFKVIMTCDVQLSMFTDPLNINYIMKNMLKLFSQYFAQGSMKTALYKILIYKYLVSKKSFGWRPLLTVFADT